MIHRFTTDELLAEWSLRKGFEPLRNDCQVTRTDGIDLRQLMLRDMHAWYMDLLHTAPVRLLPVSDLASAVPVGAGSDGSAVINLPANVCRVVEVRLAGWHRSAVIVTDMSSPQAVAQTNPYSRAGCYAPVALVDGKVLRLYSPPSGAAIALESLLCVELPPPDVYPLHPEALALIPSSLTL